MPGIQGGIYLKKEDAVNRPQWQFKTKREAVYELLKEDILSGRLEPGERLVMSQLSASFGTSQIPLREAIRQLEAEGLVAIIPHVGASVADISINDLREVLIIRGWLESLATQLACQHIDTNRLDSLRKIVDQQENALRKGDLTLYGQLNREFHESIYRACPLERLNNMIKDLWDLAERERTRAVFSLVPRRAAEAINEHRQILAVLAERDQAKVQELMIEHKKHVVEVLDVYKENKGAIDKP